MSNKIKYKLRPGFDSDNLLIEFVSIDKVKSFLKRLLKLLKKAGFKYQYSEDIWVNDEVLIHLSSANGTIEISATIWDDVFILGDKNQKDILKIDEILSESKEFLKEPVNYTEYKIAKE